jgi:hypothetical protein
MNCGISARKNSATLGFRRLLRMPWRNALQRPSPASAMAAGPRQQRAHAEVE